MINEIQNNLRSVLDKVAKLSAEVGVNTRLVAVSKTKPSQDILEAYHLGQLHFGESIQELIEKASELPKDIHWHFIGSLQSNKIKNLAKIPNLFVIETVDGYKKASILNKACVNRPEPLKIFLQINTSGEDSKSGAQPSEAVTIAKQIVEDCDKLSLSGLMTIGSPENSSNELLNPDFALLGKLKFEIERELNLSDLELSMGMSDDYEKAIKQGSTNVRVGSTIFGARNYTK